MKINYPSCLKLSYFQLLPLLLVAVVVTSFSPQRPGRVLVFSKTAGYYHESIVAGIAAIQKLGKQHHFVVDTTKDSTRFNSQNLKQYSAVIFLNTTGNVLNSDQQDAFEKYIKSGGGFVGVHAATDTEYDWPWYGKLVGAYFDGHPGNPNVRKGTFYVADKNHLATDSIPSPWEREDEFYSFKQINPDIKVLIKIDEKSYGGGKNGDNHPMSWYHEYSGGLAFYTNMGHTKETYSDPLFLKHLWGGMQYAMGGKKSK